ncbi:MAG: hypothetical protein H6648_07540 [Caldilineae bacterium]|nr:hypothetical protein [Chloroflexota bacterium]MCB9176996.1 hypothetical protein [Caldilineae bacterium]
MRDIEPELRRRGAQLIVIGNGSPAHARAFAAEAAIPFALYVDPERLAYRAAGTGKGIAPGTFSASLRAMRKGHRQTATRGDAAQNGGVFVFDAEGRERYRQISRFSGDHADPAEILAALPRPTPAARMAS